MTKSSNNSNYFFFCLLLTHYQKAIANTHTQSVETPMLVSKKGLKLLCIGLTFPLCFRKDVKTDI